MFKLYLLHRDFLPAYSLYLGPLQASEMTSNRAILCPKMQLLETRLIKTSRKREEVMVKRAGPGDELFSRNL